MFLLQSPDVTSTGSTIQSNNASVSPVYIIKFKLVLMVRQYTILFKVILHNYNFAYKMCRRMVWAQRKLDTRVSRN